MARGTSAATRLLLAPLLLVRAADALLLLRIMPSADMLCFVELAHESREQFFASATG